MFFPENRFLYKKEKPSEWLDFGMKKKGATMMYRAMQEINTSLVGNSLLEIPKELLEHIIAVVCNNIRIRILCGEDDESIRRMEAPTLASFLWQHRSQLSLQGIERASRQLISTVSESLITQILNAFQKIEVQECVKISREKKEYYPQVQMGDVYDYTTKQGKQLEVRIVKEIDDVFIVEHGSNRFFPVQKSLFFKNVFGIEENAESIIQTSRRVFYKGEGVIYTSTSGSEMHAWVESQAPDGGVILRDNDGRSIAVSPFGLSRIEQREALIPYEKEEKDASWAIRLVVLFVLTALAELGIGMIPPEIEKNMQDIAHRAQEVLEEKATTSVAIPIAVSTKKEFPENNTSLQVQKSIHTLFYKYKSRLAPWMSPQEFQVMVNDFKPFLSGNRWLEKKEISESIFAVWDSYQDHYDPKDRQQIFSGLKLVLGIYAEDHFSKKFLKKAVKKKNVQKVKQSKGKKSQKMIVPQKNKLFVPISDIQGNTTFMVGSGGGGVQNSFKMNMSGVNPAVSDALGKYLLNPPDLSSQAAGVRPFPESAPPLPPAVQNIIERRIPEPKNEVIPSENLEGEVEVPSKNEIPTKVLPSKSEIPEAFLLQAHPGEMIRFELPGAKEGLIEEVGKFSGEGYLYLYGNGMNNSYQSLLQGSQNIVSFQYRIQYPDGTVSQTSTVKIVIRE